MNYGCKKEVNDKRDFKMKMSKVAKINTFPKEHKIQMPRVKNQGTINSCVAHSLSTFMEEYYKEENKSRPINTI